MRAWGVDERGKRSARGPVEASTRPPGRDERRGQQSRRDPGGRNSPHSSREGAARGRRRLQLMTLRWRVQLGPAPKEVSYTHAQAQAGAYAKGLVRRGGRPRCAREIALMAEGHTGGPRGTARGAPREASFAGAPRAATDWACAAGLDRLMVAGRAPGRGREVERGRRRVGARAVGKGLGGREGLVARTAHLERRRVDGLTRRRFVWMGLCAHAHKGHDLTLSGICAVQGPAPSVGFRAMRGPTSRLLIVSGGQHPVCKHARVLKSR